MSWLLKGCECGGDMFPEYENNQKQFTCLQCGRTKRIDFTVLKPELNKYPNKDRKRIARERRYEI